MKILLHTCCAPCTVYPLGVLRERGHDICLPRQDMVTYHYFGRWRKQFLSPRYRTRRQWQPVGNL